MAATAEAPLATRLETLLIEELRLCQDLRDQLRQERLLFQNHDHEAGLALLQHKQALLDTLQQLAAQRAQLLRQHGFATLGDCLATLPAFEAAALRPLHNALRTLGRDCAEENRHLGQYLHRQTRFFEFLLAHLLPARHHAPTYGEDGRRPSDGRLGPGVTV